MPKMHLASIMKELDNVVILSQQNKKNVVIASHILKARVGIGMCLLLSAGNTIICDK